MSDKPAGLKLPITQGSKFLLDNPPEGRVAMLKELPVRVSLTGKESCPIWAIQVLCADRSELKGQHPQSKHLTEPEGMLGVIYHKVTSNVQTDVNRDIIIAYARTIGWQGLAVAFIDE
jgi:hypothetical protein